MFSSNPIEYRNPPFKRHLNTSMRGWCLRRPRITRLGMRHVVPTDALSVGLQLYEARQGRGAAVVSDASGMWTSDDINAVAQCDSSPSERISVPLPLDRKGHRKGLGRGVPTQEGV